MNLGQHDQLGACGAQGLIDLGVEGFGVLPSCGITVVTIAAARAFSRPPAPSTLETTRMIL